MGEGSHYAAVPLMPRKMALKKAKNLPLQMVTVQLKIK
jgi:hypothetical protein